MRTASGLVLPARPPLVAGANSIFRQNATALPSLGVTALTNKLANQCYYSVAAQSGKFYGYSGMGYGGSSEGFATFINSQAYTDPLWVVPYGQPRKKLWLVKEEEGPEETVRSFEAVQKSFNAVPLPTVALIPQRQIQSSSEEIGAIGLDRNAVIWCPATDELWEIHRLGIFQEGPHAGEWKFGFGHYQAKASEWNGITLNETGQLSASGLSAIHSDINLSDFVRVQRGGKIGHALGMAVYVLANEHLPPARTNDHGENTHKFLADGTTANPAFGNVDAVPEGLWCRFPPASRASEYGMTRPLEIAIYEAIREYGLVVRDRAGNTATIVLGDARTLYTPYCDASVDPMAGASLFSTYAHTNVPEAVWKGWADPTLPAFTGALTGKEGVLAKMPWRTLEQLEPRSS